MRAASQRRPKSPAASRMLRRTQVSEAPPWNSSIHTEGHRSLTPGAVRKATEQLISVAPETPERLSYQSLISTPVAALVANMPLAGEPQVELLSQLQDVVVRLSHSAVGEKQRLSHMQQRINAYAALVREQDRMIDELRGMNIKLQKERDTLIAFRQQSLNHDLYLMNTLEADGGVDEEVRRAYAQHVQKPMSYGASQSNFLTSLTPQIRSFVRSLVAQLRDERRKRLEVEEQSSRMIGEQQLTIQRLEDRLRPQAVATRTSFFGRMESQHATCSRGVEKEEQGMANTPMRGPDDASQEVSSSSPLVAVSAVNQNVKEEERPSQVSVSLAAPLSVMPPILHSDHEREVSTPFASVSVTSAKVLGRQSQAPELPLAIHASSYEDAAAILSDIRRRHGL